MVGSFHRFVARLANKRPVSLRQRAARISRLQRRIPSTFLCASLVPLCLCLATGARSPVAGMDAFSVGEPNSLQNRIAQTEWARVRGANFIPSYASNTYEIWRNYDHDKFEEGIRLVQGVGYNSVRLWLNYQAYEELGAAMVDRVEDAVRICARHNLRAVVVLFDSCGVHPRKDAKWMTASDAYDEFQKSARFSSEQKAFMATCFRIMCEGLERAPWFRSVRIRPSWLFSGRTGNPRPATTG